MIKSLFIHNKHYKLSCFFEDLSAGLAVFLIALPLCLGVALASNTPLFSGILAGIIGGIVVGWISGSHTSVSGPSAGLTAVVASQISTLGSFDAFLMAIVLAGIFQIFLSLARMGYIAIFFPSSVIKGLLAAVGIILILKQIPHLLGNDMDPMGDKSFFQPNNKNTISELIESIFHIHPGALLVGSTSMFLMFFWEKFAFLKKTRIPAPLVVVVIALIIQQLLKGIGGIWTIEPSHLVQVPIATSLEEFFSFFTLPKLNSLLNMDVYTAALMIGIVASLESLLNIEAIDKLDPMQRVSPPNRELLAQGIGNIIVGLIGGLPITSVIVRGSVNVQAGAKSKVSAIWHGGLLLGSVLLIPYWLNSIPLSALAAILFVTGIKLVNPKLIFQIWQEGKYQFLPFICTVTAIVFTDFLIGILIGLFVSIAFILNSNMRNPIKKAIQKHATGDQVLHVELPNQVSFFNKSSLESTLRSTPIGGHILLDATSTDYIDPDILDLIMDFQNRFAPIHGIHVSLKGFKDHSHLKDQIQYVDISNRETQDALTPEKVLEILKEGNRRFRAGTPIPRDFTRLLSETSTGQFPMAVILSCIDSRSPVEILFDLGLGDVFSIRIAGNVISKKILGSMEYGCAVAGAKLILVMGHTSCGAVRAAVDLTSTKKSASEATHCTHLDSLIHEIQYSINSDKIQDFHLLNPHQKENYSNQVAHQNVSRTIKQIRKRSQILNQLITERKIAIVGAMYDISSGQVSFFQ